METNATPYPPIRKGPLRISGIFGIAFALFKRGLGAGLAFTALLVLLPMLISMLQPLLYLQDIVRLFSSDMPFYDSFFSGGSRLGGYLALGLLSSLLSFLSFALLMPAYKGAMHLEMQQHANGKRGTCMQLLRYALPAGLKRTYSTYWCTVLINAAVSVALGIVVSFVSFAVVFQALLRFAGGHMEGGAYIGIAVAAVLVALLFGCISSMCTLLIFPVCVYENKTNFQAVARAFALLFQNLGRMLGVTFLYVLLLTCVRLLLFLPCLLLLGANSTAGMLICYLFASVALMLTVLYEPAFATALYMDLSFRSAHRPPPYFVEPAQSAQANEQQSGAQHGHDEHPSS